MKKLILINYMYRDGGNYKSHDQAVFENDMNASCEDVEKVLQRCGIKLYEPIIFDYYGLLDFGFKQISPVENEFSYGGEYDHPYQEITEIEESTAKDYDEEDFEAEHKLSSLLKNLASLNERTFEHRRIEAAKESSERYQKISDALEHFVETGDESKLDNI